MRSFFKPYFALPTIVFVQVGEPTSHFCAVESRRPAMEIRYTQP